MLESVSINDISGASLKRNCIIITAHCSIKEQCGAFYSPLTWPFLNTMSGTKSKCGWVESATCKQEKEGGGRHLSHSPTALSLCLSLFGQILHPSKYNIIMQSIIILWLNHLVFYEQSLYCGCWCGDDLRPMRIRFSAGGENTERGG